MSRVVEKYLTKIKRLWPTDKCRYTEDLALKYLHKCQYNIHMALILAEQDSLCYLLDSLCSGCISI